MLNKEQILEATGEELSKIAGEVLEYGGNINRKIVPKGSYYHFFPEGCGGVCSKCGEQINKFDTYCTETNPVDLTWPEAMKWRDWAVKEFREVVHQAMWDVCCATSEHGSNTAFSYWLATTVQPEHYIKAACLCKLETLK